MCDEHSKTGDPAVGSARLLECAGRLQTLSDDCEKMGDKCDAAELPPQYGDWERGKAAAFRISADVIKHLVAQANTAGERPRQPQT
jgi:hypothetical protein